MEQDEIDRYGRMIAMSAKPMTEPTPRTDARLPVCDDHRKGELEWPDMMGGCVPCRIAYLEAQESLLEGAQQRAKAAEEIAAEIERPLDAQMARLNATVIKLQRSLARRDALLQDIRALRKEEIYEDDSRWNKIDERIERELDERFPDHPIGDFPGCVDAMREAIRRAVEKMRSTDPIDTDAFCVELEQALNERKEKP